MGRFLTIGDIHGCFDVLQTLLNFVDFAADDTLITLGDYVNRGPDAKLVLDWLIEHHAQGQIVPLRGNHEVMMQQARDDDRSHQIWLDVGGVATLASYGRSATINDVPAAHWEFLDEVLLPWYETEHHFYVHANADPSLPLNDQPDYMLYWERFHFPAQHQSGKTMVCGHTSQKSGLPQNHNHAVCIDTWAVGDGWLTCLQPDSGDIWQANQAGQTRRMFLDDLETPTW